MLFRPDNPFTFTSGACSPVYVDCRRLISFPRARRALMDMGAKLIENRVGFESLDAIAGGETAGIPFAAWIADRLSLPMLYVRKQAKGFGRNAQIEGELKDDARVLLVEDLASEGTSKLNFVRAIRQAGGEISHTFVIFNYGIFPHTESSLAAEGITLHALATWWDVAEVAENSGASNPGSTTRSKASSKTPRTGPPHAPPRRGNHRCLGSHSEAARGLRDILGRAGEAEAQPIAAMDRVEIAARGCCDADLSQHLSAKRLAVAGQRGDIDIEIERALGRGEAAEPACCIVEISRSRLAR